MSKPTKLFNAGNPGWSGELYTGIPAGGTRTNPGLQPILGPLTDKGGLEQLPLSEGYNFGANYFLTRGINTSIGTDFLANPWTVLNPSCLRPGTFNPPTQYNRNLQCKHLSYPMFGDVCLSSENLLNEIGQGTGTTYVSGPATNQRSLD